MTWIDMHCHLDKLEEGVESAIQKAKSVGVDRLVTIGTEPDDHQRVLAIAQKYYPEVFCTLGVHPHEGVLYNEQVGQWLRKHLADPAVIAVGEIGLDYYYNQSPQKEQKESFREQLQIAKEFSMPVEIHTRDAEADTIEILNEFKGDVQGIIHCFTGTDWLATKALDLGFNISISGVVTFKNAESLRSTVRKIPLDRVHVETDAPFLAPIPHRGKPNTPAYVVHTAQVVAGLLQVSEEKLSEATRQNAVRMFPKMSVRV